MPGRCYGGAASSFLGVVVQSTFAAGAVGAVLQRCDHPHLPGPISMTYPMHTSSIPVFRQMLGALKDVLAKTAAHATARKIEPDALLQARLYPDMFPMARQMLADRLRLRKGRLRPTGGR